MRTGPSNAELWTTIADPHQTVTIAINNNAKPSEGVIKRRMDPWGNPRGTNPTWPTDRGYLNKPTDATGLTSVGARYYDPAFGRFISVDPVMNLTDPNQWGAYAYANNNPVTKWDPTGLQTAVKGDWAPGQGPKDRPKPLSGGQKALEFVKGVGSGALNTVKGLALATNPITATITGFSQARAQWNYYTNPNDKRSFWDKAGGQWSQMWRSLFPWTSTDAGTDDRARWRAWGGFTLDAGLTAWGGAGAVAKVARVARAAGAAGEAAATADAATVAANTAPVWDEVPLFVETPYGIATQAWDPASLALRDQVLKGSSVFKGGSASSLPATESQFFAAESPTTAGFAARYGIPEGNLPFDWISEGTVRPGAPFVTRPAPGVGSNLGGAREVVTVPGAFLPAG